jgi:hypothetical protein
LVCWQLILIAEWFMREVPGTAVPGRLSAQIAPLYTSTLWQETLRSMRRNSPRSTRPGPTS